MIQKMRIAMYKLPVHRIMYSAVLSLFMLYAKGQQVMPLNDLSAFKNPGKTWKIGATATADIGKANALMITPGTGVLANVPGERGEDLYTLAEYGDIDLEVDFMMAKGSNSGIYLQGRYELQLMDSWGVKSPTAGDNGAIYQRWDERRPAGQYGFEGNAPRQNASKAPGLWQKLRISFQAPRFDAAGKKTENAKFLRVELNGVTIHEDVDLSGPTRGAMSNNEQPIGPLRFQGDHGPVAFKNFKITQYDKPRPTFSEVKYAVYRGRFYDTLDLKKLPPEAEGTLSNLSAISIQNVPSEFFIKYTGKIDIKEPGAYAFNMAVPGGRGILSINNQLVNQQGNRQRTTQLAGGEFPFELLYTKTQDWTDRTLGIDVAGPGIRQYSLGDVVTAGGNVDPILVDASVNTILRSFMDMPGGTRVVHAVSVGSPDKVHYTYDMDKAAIIQVWRGGFLDATPMWYSRGDGSSRPVGAVQRFGKPGFTLAKLPSINAPWVEDSIAVGYMPKGYRVDKADIPTFRYMLDGTLVEDAIRVLSNGEGISREITLQNPLGTYFARLVQGVTIEDAGNGLYVVDGNAYYIKLDDATDAKPAIIADANGNKSLLVPVQQKLKYSILF